MAHRIDDRWLWLGAGIALVLTIKGISYAITDTVRLTQVKPLGKDQDEELQRQPEDCTSKPFHYKPCVLTILPAIPLDVLRTLATSPNPNISKSAIDLIAARCVKTSSLVSSVQADAASSDTDLRRKARAAMHFLSGWTLGSDMGNPVPPGMRTGGSTGALNLSPSMLSLDSSFEFDGQGMALPPRRGAQHYDQGGVFQTFENGDTAVWTTVARDSNGEVESAARRRQRHREVMVLHGGDEVLREEEIIRPRPS